MWKFSHQHGEGGVELLVARVVEAAVRVLVRLFLQLAAQASLITTLLRLTTDVPLQMPTNGAAGYGALDIDTSTSAYAR